MSSEASSTTTSRKRKLVDSEADEIFVLQKKQENTLTKTVSVSIPDFLEKINDENNKKDPINTPKFKLGNLDFQFKVYPEYGGGNVGFALHNPNREDVTMSMDTKKPTISFTRKKWGANTIWGWPKLVSHNTYREWAAHYGDEFKMTVRVTLHLTEGSSDEEWKTLRLYLCQAFILLSYINF